VEGAVQVAQLDVVVVDEDDVGDTHPGQSLGDEASHTSEPDEANSGSGDVCLRRCAPDTEGRHLGGQLGRLRPQQRVEAQGEPIGRRDADHRDLHAFVGERGGSSPGPGAPRAVGAPGHPEERES